MSQQPTEARVSALNAKTIVMGIVLMTVVLLYEEVICRTAEYYIPYSNDVMLHILPVWFILALIFVAGSKLRMSFQEMSVLYVFLLMGGLTGNWVGSGEPMGSIWAHHPLGGGPQFATWIPDFFWRFPSNIFWWAVIYSIFMLSYSLLPLLWRRNLIDVQKLPFPVAAIPVEVGTRIHGGGVTEKAMKLATNKLFIIGSLVAFVYQVPYVAETLLGASVFQTPYWYGGPDLIPLLHRVMPMSAWSMHMVHWEWSQYNIFWSWGFYYMFPLDVLLTGWTAYVVAAIILPPIAVSAGWIPLIYNPGMFGNWLSYLPTWYMVTTAAGTWAIAFLLLVSNFRYFGGTLKALISGPSAAEKESEPMSYRLMWLAFIGLSLLFIVLWVAIGAEPGVVVLTVAFGLISTLSFATARAYGYNSSNQVHTWAPMTYGAVNGLYLYNSYSGVPDSVWDAKRQSIGLAGMVGGGFAHERMVFGPPQVLEMFAVGSMLKAKASDIWKAVVIATISSAFIGMFIYYWIVSVWGAGANYGFGATTWGLTGVSSGKPTTTPGQFSMYNLELFFGGVVMYTILWVLRLRLPWFPLNPIGLMFVDAHFAAYAQWVPFMLAWLAKYLTFKVGGSELYEKMLPLWLGFIVGGSFALFAQAGAFIIKHPLKPIPGPFFPE